MTLLHLEGLLEVAVIRVSFNSLTAESIDANQAISDTQASLLSLSISRQQLVL